MQLSMLLEMATDGFGDRILVGRRAAGLTATDLSRRADAGARLLQDSGADALVYLDVNGPAFPVALFAAARAGVPLVPLNYRLGQTQLDALLAKHPRATVLVGEGAEHRIAATGLPTMTTAQWLEVTATGSAGPGEPATPGAPAVIIYTSGTTAEPKGVLLRHENLVSYVFGSVDFASADAEHASLISVPPYHIAAVANTITNLYAGRRALVLESFSADEWLETVRAERVTSAMVVPTMLARILDGGTDLRVPSLRSLSYGGAPMPASVLERALRQWPDVDFVNAYGLTETSSTIALLGPEEHRGALASDDPRIRARLGSAGRALPGVEIVIRDHGGQVLPPGVPGRICVRGEQVSAEYAGIGRLVDAEGYFDTRDEGYLDDEGYLFIGGRSDDTIIRGAENIAPAEIEAVLLRHEAISDAVVFGVADDEWGQRIEAAVVLRQGTHTTAEDVREHAKAVLRSSKTPDQIWFVDQLPRTETGKLLRRQVSDLIPSQPEPARS